MKVRARPVMKILRILKSKSRMKSQRAEMRRMKSRVKSSQVKAEIYSRMMMM